MDNLEARTDLIRAGRRVAGRDILVSVTVTVRLENGRLIDLPVNPADVLLAWLAREEMGGLEPDIIPFSGGPLLQGKPQSHRAAVVTETPAQRTFPEPSQ